MMAGNHNSGRLSAAKRKEREQAAIKRFTKKRPASLNGMTAAKRFWDDTVRELEGTLSDKDCYAVEVAACLYQEIVDLRKALKKHGHTFMKQLDRSQAQIPYKRPEVVMLRERNADFTRLLNQLGLTPKSHKWVKNKPASGDFRMEKYK